MNPWRRNPFFRIVIPFVSGIVFAHHYRVAWAEMALFLLLLALAFVLLVERQKLYVQFKWVKGVVICAMLFALGAALAAKERQPSGLALHRGGGTMYAGRVTDTLQRFIWGQIAEVHWYPLNDQGKPDRPYLKHKPVRARTLFSGNRQQLMPGDRMVAEVDWESPRKARFQGEFNEQSFLRSKGFFIKASVREGRWMRLQSTESAGDRLAGWVVSIRFAVDRSLEQYLADSIHTGVMKALLIGDRSEIPPTVSKKLAGSGITHVLAVSGLHVGIVYWLMSGVLNLLLHGRMRKWLSPPLLILFLAAYVLLTGSSPSVIRAAVMLSVIVLARAMGFKGSAVNTVLFTGFVILLVKPHLFFNLGFQLSFLAVLGILWMYPRLKKWYYPASFVPRRIVDMIYVSIAAQLATTPLAIAYFQLFPTYFLLSNLLIAPLLILALYTGIGLVVFGMAGSNVLSALAGKGITALLSLAFGGVELLEKLPFFVVTGLYIRHEQLIWYIIVIACLAAVLFYRQFVFLWAAVLSLAVAFTLQMASIHRAGQSSEITILRHRGSELLLFRSGRQALAVHSGEPSQKEGPMENDLRNFRRFHHLSVLHRCKNGTGFTTSDPALLGLLNAEPTFRRAEIIIVQPGMHLPPPDSSFRALYIPKSHLNQIARLPLRNAHLLILPSTTPYPTALYKKIKKAGFTGTIHDPEPPKQF